MGLFSSKKVYVSSTISNLAGDAARRPDYLKTAVLSKTLLNQASSMGDVIKEAYLHGPGIKLRSFYRWASVNENYNRIGMPTSTLLLKTNFGTGDLEEAIGSVTGGSVVVIESEVGEGEFSFWAEQYMLENYPELFDGDWVADYDTENNLIIISLPDDSQVSFTPFNFDPEGLYLYALYSELDADGRPFKDGLFIYKRGDGVAVIDNEIKTTQLPNDGFFPFIPVRLENKFLAEDYHKEAYEQAKRAFKKATGGGRLSEIQKSLEESDSLDDIDHAYVVFGPSLNAKDQQSKEYVWTFFTMILEQMKINNQTGTGALEDYITGSETNETETANYLEWLEAQEDETNPAYGTAAPSVTNSGTFPRNSIRIAATNQLPGQLDIEISWSGVEITEGTGEGKTGAKVGDVWWGSEQSSTTSSHLLGSIIETVVRETGGDSIYKQVEADKWVRYSFRGLVHKNHVYGGKSVEITASEALDDAEESGFFIPLHYETLKAMSLVDSTQLALVSTQLVMNSYLVKKTNFLKKLLTIVIIIAVVVIGTAIFGPAGGVGIGATIAASLGVAGLAALIVSVAINMIVALIVQAILTEAFTLVLGDRLGAIFAAIATVFVMGGLNNIANGLSFTASFGSMMSAQNLMMLTNSVGNGIADYVRASAMEYHQKAADYIEEGEKKQSEIDNKWIEEFGMTYGVIDPMDLLNPASYTPEDSDSFIARTLMTGSDIAELSMDMLTNFAELTLQPNV